MSEITTNLCTAANNTTHCTVLLTYYLLSNYEKCAQAGSYNSSAIHTIYPTTILNFNTNFSYSSMQ